MIMEKMQESVKKSQIDLIIGKFLNNLGNHSEFDEISISRLTDLASKGLLNNSDLIEKAILVQFGEKNEDK